MAALAVLGLVACGGSDENSIEQAIEEASGGNADVEIGEDGNIEVSTSDGSYSVGESADVPDNFPSEVPLPDGLNLTGAFSDDSGWYLNYVSDSLSKDFCEEFLGAYEAAGFVEETRFDSGGDLTGVYSNEQYTVSASCSPSIQSVIVSVQDNNAE